MNQRVWTLVLLVGLGYGSFALIAQAAALRPFGNRQGYEPEQPIAFSHRLHAGEMAIPCGYCHTAADQSRHAAIPDAGTCLNCHRNVTAASAAVKAEKTAAEAAGRAPRKLVSPELRKLYDALALDDDLRRDPEREPEPIRWTKIHDLPDFVFFSHQAHVSAGVDCARCHGPVETMDRMRQVESLSMGWCVDCHRQANETGINGRPVQASTDCATCHY